MLDGAAPSGTMAEARIHAYTVTHFVFWDPIEVRGIVIPQDAGRRA